MNTTIHLLAIGSWPFHHGISLFWGILAPQPNLTSYLTVNLYGNFLMQILKLSDFIKEKGNGQNLKPMKVFNRLCKNIFKLLKYTNINYSLCFRKFIQISIS